MNQPENPLRARLAVMASVVGLSAVITGPAWWGTGRQAERASYLTPLVSAASSSAAARSTAARPVASPASAHSAEAVQGTPLCGSSIPVPVFAPAGYRGPLPGPARGASQPELPGQLVAHWTGSAGDVEVRWPADAASAQAGGPVDPVDPREATFTLNEGGPGGTGAFATMLLKEQKVGCTAMRLTVYGRIPAGLAERMGADETGNAAFDALAALVTDPATPLVVGRRHVGRAPAHALTCQGGSPPSRSGRAPRSAARSDPRAALRAFLEPADHSTPPVRAGRGYLELVDGAGRITYGKPIEGGGGYVALIRMAHRGGGWVVDRWETSGC
jgi:hypothetical protein